MDLQYVIVAGEGRRYIRLSGDRLVGVTRVPVMGYPVSTSGLSRGDARIVRIESGPMREEAVEADARHFERAHGIALIEVLRAGEIPERSRFEPHWFEEADPDVWAAHPAFSDSAEA